MTKASLLPQVASGELFGIGVEEGAHHNPLGVTATAEVSGSTAKVTGSKKFVLDGHVANKLIVAARSAAQQATGWRDLGTDRPGCRGCKCHTNHYGRLEMQLTLN